MPKMDPSESILTIDNFFVVHIFMGPQKGCISWVECSVIILLRDHSSGQVTYNMMPLKRGRALFTSFVFCNNKGSYSLRLNMRIYICIHSSIYSLRLNTRIYICIHSSIFYFLELAVMINLHKYEYWTSLVIKWSTSV